MVKLAMEFETKFKYGEGEACFRIFKEDPGIYYAKLLYYTGSSKERMVKDLTLIRGIRYWAGSSDDKVLHHALGKAIEGRVKFLTERIRR